MICLRRTFVVQETRNLPRVQNEYEIACPLSAGGSSKTRCRRARLDGDGADALCAIREVGGVAFARRL